VPDEVDVVELGADRLGRPGSAAGSTDQVEAGVDASDVVVQVFPGERAGADVFEVEFGGCCPSGGHAKPFDERVVVHDLFPSVRAPRWRRWMATGTGALWGLDDPNNLQLDSLG